MLKSWHLQYFDDLRQLWGHLSKIRQKQFLAVIALNVLSAASEMLGLGILLPFLAILVSPEKALSIEIISNIVSFWGINSSNSLLLFFTISFIVVTLVAAALKMYSLHKMSLLSSSISSDLSVAIYLRTLSQPYKVHISRNSSLIISGIGTKVSQSMNFLYQSLIIINSFLVLIAVVTALIMIDPIIAMTTLMGTGMAYLAISRIVKKRLIRNSAIHAEQSPKSIKALQEGLGGIRDVLLDGSQEFYSNLYAEADAKIRKAQNANLFINMVPRYLMEAFAMIFIALLAWSMASSEHSSQFALPVLGTLVLGIQKMLPALQGIYGAWASIAGSQASITDTLTLLNQPFSDKSLNPNIPPLKFSNEIKLHNVNYSYPNSEFSALNNIDLIIKKGERIGIVGTTGGGKSTLLDILMGLLEPTHGALIVDGEIIEGDKYLAWRQSIAQVPQAIFLADATFAENIALGVPINDIQMDRVKRAAHQAKISNLIESRIDGYFTTIGERGVQLSGGQRQRVAIARALYKNASVLILDEATSALDNDTEQEVMSAIDDLDSNLTIIIVAHRVETVKKCDKIIRLENSKIFASGTYSQVIENKTDN